MNIDTHSVAPVPLIVFPSGIGLSWIGSGFLLFCMLHTRNQLVHRPTHELSVWMETCRKRSSGIKRAESGDSTRTDRWRHTAAQCYWYSSFNGWMWMMREMKRHKKYLHSSSGQHGCAWDSAPSAGDGWYCHAVQTRGGRPAAYFYLRTAKSFLLYLADKITYSLL